MLRVFTSSIVRKINCVDSKNIYFTFNRHGRVPFIQLKTMA